MKPEVSVIMPVYNSENYLKEAIISVLNQTFKNFEFIIINDCSTDNSEQIINYYSHLDKRIIYLKLNHNSGQAVARNKGLNITNGKYISFIDSDDVWRPNKLKEDLCFLKSHHLDFIYGLYDMIYEDNSLKKHVKFLPKKITYWNLLTTDPISMSATMIKRNVIGDVRFPNMPCEDYAFWLQLFREKNVKNHLLPYNCSKRRMHRHSNSSNKFKSCEWVWNLYRNQEHLNLFVSLIVILIWAIKGSIKHLSF